MRPSLRLLGYQESELVKLDILVNREPVDALSFIVHKDSATERGRKCAEKLKRKFPDICLKFPFSGNRQQNYRQRNHQRNAQGCSGKMLWR